MDRKKIAERIRALRAKTEANGCTEEEAAAAAAMVAKLLERYGMTLDETEMRETGFSRERHAQDDLVGRCIHRVASAIAYMIDIRYWASKPGEEPAITFFGFDHEVEIASYLLDICRNAMTTQSERMGGELRLLRENVRRRRITAFLDGMADRLAQRIRDLKPPTPTGTGLVVLRTELIDAELDRLDLRLEKKRGRPSRSLDEEYGKGRAAGDRVALNRGIGRKESDRTRLTQEDDPD
ncbi:DUF2786 domain-containing protein [uncultured Salinicola sp.]|uniref:DUF7168 domain-containing protein n=1 Tax=uncultured Salinicola sp. TaxID=1193542 RepID=UPI00262FDE47|nr:DUF2786 domain-containing protein [uncultured Salinicola sp.]